MDAEAIQAENSSSRNHKEPTIATAEPAPFLTIQNVPVYFQEDWSKGIGGGLWSTGLAMAQYFASDESNPLPSIQTLARRKEGNLNVLELGSGNGFLAVCLAALARQYIQKLYITDTLDHLTMIKQTLMRNSNIIALPDEKVEASNGKVVAYVVDHVWGQFDSELSEAKLELFRTPFDLIIGSDLAYREDLYDPLIQSLLYFSTSTTISLIGVTMLDTTAEFFVQLEKAGFCYERLAEHLLMPEYRGSTFGIFVIQKRNVISTNNAVLNKY